MPEVTYCSGGFGSHTFHDTGHSGHPRSSSDKLEQHNNEQLGKISQSALTTIMLQIAVYHETDAGIECLIGCLRAVTIGIEWQPTL